MREENDLLPTKASSVLTFYFAVVGVTATFRCDFFFFIYSGSGSHL
jgi:hypothetical protein